jgi:hypothetical protein
LPISDQACATKRLLHVLDAVDSFRVVSWYIQSHQLIWNSN